MINQNLKIEKQRLKCLGDRYYVFSVPKAFIDNGILKLDKEYEISISEVSTPHHY
jgi:hypothetical protein